MKSKLTFLFLFCSLFAFIPSNAFANYGVMGNRWQCRTQDPLIDMVCRGDLEKVVACIPEGAFANDAEVREAMNRAFIEWFSAFAAMCTNKVGEGGAGNIDFEIRIGCQGDEHVRIVKKGGCRGVVGVSHSGSSRSPCLIELCEYEGKGQLLLGAHEFGHTLGFYDEYIRDAQRLCANSPFRERLPFEAVCTPNGTMNSLGAQNKGCLGTNELIGVMHIAAINISREYNCQVDGPFKCGTDEGFDYQEDDSFYYTCSRNGEKVFESHCINVSVCDEQNALPPSLLYPYKDTAPMP